MKTLRRVTTLLLFLSLILPLASIPWARIARAQSGEGDGQEAETAPQFDYVADATNEWTAKYGADDGSGDWRYYHNDLFDADHKAQIGSADGYCIENVPGEWSYCTWSLYTHSWTLSAHGLWDESAKENQYAIAGGTGEYADAHGYLHIATNQDASQYFFTVEVQEVVAYESLHIIADATEWKSTHFGDPATSYANVWYWHEPAYSDEEETDQIGSSDGYCIWTGPNRAAECNWTITGEGWSISASGRKFDEGESSLTITSGSGEYAGATGTVTWDTSPDGARSWLLYNFDFLPTTLHKPFDVNVEAKGFLYGDTPQIGDAKGDLYYWHAPMWNKEKSEQIGWSDGFCVITAPENYSSCTLTLYTDNWSLTASGPRYESNSPSLLAVTGGSGAYADVAGTLVIKLNEEGTHYEIAMDLTVAPFTYWAFVNWNQVTEEETPTWYTLGWNEDNWDGSHPAAVPDSESRTWQELTPFEQQAATSVGYDEESWNPSVVRTPEGNPDDFWAQFAWGDLFVSEQRLWGILGWEESNWAGVPAASMPASNWRTWNELKPVEQGAASELGYDEASWNAHIVRTPEGDVEEFWSQFAWDELSHGEQQLFALLGWNAESWAGEQPIPEANYQTWEELSQVEKGAANQLGYGVDNWDEKVLVH